MTSKTLLTADDYAAFSYIQPEKRIAYGPMEHQFADFYPAQSAQSAQPAQPAQPEHPAPLLVLIHGGCWRSKYGLEPLSGMAQALAGHGYCVLNIEYRRMHDALERSLETPLEIDEAVGGWPNTFNDLNSIMDQLPTLLADCPIDWSRVVTVGHSAGGHLAAYALVRKSLPTSSPLYREQPLSVKGVVSLAGIIDLKQGIIDNICSGACAQIIGATTHQALTQAFSARVQQASPIEWAEAGQTWCVINGDEDWVVPLGYAEHCVKRLHQQHIHVDPILLKNVGHFELVDTHSVVWPTVLAAIERVFNG